MGTTLDRIRQQGGGGQGGASNGSADVDFIFRTAVKS